MFFLSKLFLSLMNVFHGTFDKTTCVSFFYNYQNSMVTIMEIFIMSRDLSYICNTIDIFKGVTDNKKYIPQGACDRKQGC